MPNSDDVLKDLAEAPVTLNVFPQRSAEAICGFLEVMEAEGCRILEILCRPLAEAADLLRQLNDMPQRTLAHVGLGTVKTRRDAEAIVDLRPDFIVSPAFSARVLAVAAEAGIPYIPGIITLQDVQDVLEAFEDHGLELKVLKVCPINILNYEYFEVLHGIYPGIVFCPTGTVTMATLPKWKSISYVGPAMENWFVPAEMLDAKDWPAARGRLAEIREIVRKAKGGR